MVPRITPYIVFLVYLAGVSVAGFGAATMLTTGHPKAYLLMITGGVILVVAIILHFRQPRGALWKWLRVQKWRGY